MCTVGPSNSVVTFGWNTSVEGCMVQGCVQERDVSDRILCKTSNGPSKKGSGPETYKEENHNYRKLGNTLLSFLHTMEMNYDHISPSRTNIFKLSFEWMPILSLPECQALTPAPRIAPSRWKGLCDSIGTTWTQS